MTTAQNKIVSLASGKSGSREHNALVSAIQFMHWNIIVQHVASAAGIPVSAMLEQENAKVSELSLAGRLGHSTLKDFVQKPQSDGGLEMAWGDWSEMARAQRLKGQFGIYADDPKEIVAEYGDVAHILGRDPLDAADYHKAKDAVLIQRAKDKERQHNLQMSELRERADSALSHAEESRKRVEEERQKSERLQAQLDHEINETQRKIDEAIKVQHAEKIKALVEQKQEFETLKQNAIDAVRRESELKVNEAFEQMESIRAKFNSNNFVPKSEFEFVSDKLQKEQAQNQTYLQKIHSLNMELEEATQTIKNQDFQIGQLKTTIADQEKLVDYLQNQVNQMKLSHSGSAGLEEVQHLRAKVAELHGYVQKFRAKNKELKNGYRGMSVKLERLKLQLSVEEEKYRKKAKVAKSNKQAALNYRSCFHLTAALLMLAIGTAATFVVLL